MSIAETAQLAVDLKLGTSGSFRGATGEINAVEQAATRGVARTGFLSRGFATAGTAAGKFGGALGHAKSQLGGLVSGPLGLVGLGAGLFTVTGALEQGIEKATEMGKATSRLSRITGLSVETTSALSAALEHFGIGVDKQLRSVGFLEKNVGLLASRKNGIHDFEKTFSFDLTDANGKLKDANELILQSADYFNDKSIPATTKAAALAKLYGRSWQDLIPFLSAGRKGIAAAEEEAAKFGLTLTKDNIGALTKLREATRTWGTALGGLEVQLGLLVVGPLTDLARFGTEFVAKNRTQIIDFFRQIIKGAQTFAAFITGTVVPTVQTIGTAAQSAWNAVPAPVRDLLIKGFIANKVIKFAFGFSPITFAKDALTKGLGGLLGGFFQKGGSPANPLWVASVNGGLGGLPGALGGAAGAAEGAAAGIGVAGVATAAIPLGALALGLTNNLRVLSDLTEENNQLTAQGLTANEIAAQRYYKANAADQQTLFKRWMGVLPSKADFDSGNQKLIHAYGTGGLSPDDRQSLHDSAQRLQDIKDADNSIATGLNKRNQEWITAVHGLKTATKPADVMKAIHSALALIIGGHRGSVSSTADVLKDLKHQLANTHDPKLQSALRSAIGKVEHKLSDRKMVDGLLHKADQIFRSNESGGQKLKDLQALQRELVHRGLPKAAHDLQVRIDRAKAAIAAGAMQTTAAVNRKKLSVTVQNTTVTNVNVNARDVFASQRNTSRVFSTASGASAGK